MKRIFSTLCIVAMVALVATSCKKKTDEASSFNFTLEQVKGLELDDDAKAYIDVNDLQMKWNEGDRIMVYNIDYNNYQESVAEEWEAYAGAQGQTTTGFHGVAVGPMKSMYFFFYHANKASGNLQAGNRETFTVNQVQTYNDQLDANGNPYRFDPTSLVMACPVTNGIYNQSYTFQHIFGFLNLKLKNATGKRVEKIELTDASWNLWGTMSLKICPEIDPNQFTNLMNELVASNAEGTAYDTYVENLHTYLQSIGYNANGQGRTIILDCSKADNGQGVLCESKTNFFFSLRPGALYNGFSIKVTFMDGTSKQMSFAKDMSKLIKPATFTNVSFNYNDAI